MANGVFYPRSKLRVVCGLSGLAVLAACGGGGADEPTAAGSSSTPSATAAAAPATAGAGTQAPSASPAPTNSTAIVPGTRVTCGLANFQAEAMALVNAHRAAGASCGSRGSFGAAPALEWNAALTMAAVVHSEDMVAANFFSHTGSSGSSAGQRATAAGYGWRTFGENIAAGQATVASVVAGWMASPGHCANVMNPNFRDIGLACVSGSAGNTYRSYWTMTLGSTQ